MVHGLNAADIMATERRFAQLRADAAWDRSASQSQNTRVAGRRVPGSAYRHALMRLIRADQSVQNVPGAAPPSSFSPPTTFELADPH